MKTLLATVSLVLLTGCSTMGGLAGDGADEVRDAAEFMLCKGITVGSAMRGYIMTDKAAAWFSLCRKHYE